MNWTIGTITFTLPEIISIIVGAVSMILAIISIWISLHFKRSSDEMNNETRTLLFDIKQESKVVTNGVLTELQKWGKTGRDAVIQMVGNNAQNSVPAPFKPNHSSQATTANKE